MRYLIIFLLILISIPVVNALSIYNETGTYYINWSWSNTTNEVQTIFIDGKEIQDNDTSLGYWVLTNLKPNEEHRIDIFTNMSALNNGSAYNVAKTREGNWYFPLIFTIIFMLIGGYFSFYFSYLSIISSFWGLMTIQSYTSETHIILLYGFLFMFSLYVTYEMHKRRMA